MIKELVSRADAVRLCLLPWLVLLFQAPSYCYAQQAVQTLRYEIQSDMPETGYLRPSSENRTFAVTFYVPQQEQRLPLVLFSSGQNEQQSTYSSFLSEVASDGYVVAAMEHPNLDFSVEIGGNSVSFDPAITFDLFLLPHQNGPMGTLVRSRDVGCLLDLMTTAQQEDDDGRHCNRDSSIVTTSDTENLVDFDNVVQSIDTLRVGYIGHSVGGTAAQSMVSFSSHADDHPLLRNEAYDDRISAVASYDGGHWLDWVRTGKLTKPFLFVASDQFWRDNYNLVYEWQGDELVVTCVGSPQQEEACADEPNPTILGFEIPQGPWSNKRKIIESRVACRSDGYAVRLFGSMHNFMFNDQSGTVIFEESLKYTKVFLGTHLNKDHSGSILGDVDPAIGKVYSNEEVNDTVCSTQDAPDADRDGDGLSNGDELVLFLTDPDMSDTDGDLICDGREALEFTNPAVSTDYHQSTDTSCFEALGTTTTTKPSSSPIDDPGPSPTDEPSARPTPSSTAGPSSSPIAGNYPGSPSPNDGDNDLLSTGEPDVSCGRSCMSNTALLLCLLVLWWTS